MNQEKSESIINFHFDFNRFLDETCRVLEGLQLPCSPLQYVLRQELVNQDGLWLELGVGSGHTLNLICEYRRKGTVYGFGRLGTHKFQWIGINGTQTGKELVDYCQYGLMGERWFPQSVPLKERVAVRILSSDSEK